MHKLSSFVVVALAVGAMSCQVPLVPEPAAESAVEQHSVVLNNCTGGETPAHAVPPYVPPADDGVALDSLLEASSYGITGDWVGMASGNFCGGAEKELVAMKNTSNYFSILRGPTPFGVGSGDINSNPAHAWKAVAAGKLDAGAYDLIAAVRNVTTTGVPDLVVARVDATSCFLTQVVASLTIGGPSNSKWVGAAIGNFDGTGNQIALLKAEHANLVLARLVQGHALSATYASDLDNASTQWKALAAGDLDHDGIDELVAVRKVSDGVSPTILVYKWINGGFQLFATSGFGNTGNSDWAGVAVGDFNGDGRNAIVVMKNAHSNFAVLDVPAGTSNLRLLTTGDLDSVSGVDWRAATATDWLTGDQGAAELVALRKLHTPYKVDLFIYGNAFHRAARDSGLAHAKAVWDQHRYNFDPNALDFTTLVAELEDSHVDTVNWTITEHVFDAQHLLSDDYAELVAFLDATKNTCIDGKHLRVWVTLHALQSAGVPDDKYLNICSWPRDSGITPWHELDYFNARGDATDKARCNDFVAWSSVLGHLAADYPHVVAVSVDDYGDHPDSYNDNIPEMESNIRSQAPWVNFVPIVYYHTFTNDKWPDITRMLDNVQFFFRNEKAGQCTASPCGDGTVPNMPGEVADINAVLPSGRKAMLGMYFVTIDGEPGPPSINYDYNLTQLALQQSTLGGVTAYSMPPNPGGSCGRRNCCSDASVLSSPFCVLWKLYGADGKCTPGIDQSCGNCGAQTCNTGFSWNGCGAQGTCSPGSTTQTACGNCGTRVDTCSNSCQWITGSCGGQGECAPGDTLSCCPCFGGQSCNTAGEQFCNSSCSWGGCTGYACGDGEPQ